MLILKIFDNKTIEILTSSSYVYASSNLKEIERRESTASKLETLKEKYAKKGKLIECKVPIFKGKIKLPLY